jgi:hypothetical protein
LLGNLHGIALGLVTAVNPLTPATVAFSTGNTINVDGSVTPSYSPPVNVLVQMQSLTYNDLRQVEGLNLTGTRRALYVFNDLQGTVRATMQGGDLITIVGPCGGFPAGTVWLVAMALESWGNPAAWAKAAVTLQDGS